MAQDQQQQNRNPSQPAKTQASAPVGPSSPFYSKETPPPGNVTPPVQWLFERGWKCLGDPSWTSAEWYDPTRPLQTESFQEPCFGWVERLDHSQKDAQGRPKLVWKHEHLMDQDGTTRGNQTIPIMQTVVVPPASAMTLQEAIRCQLDRERRAVEDTKKQQKVA